MFNDLSKILHLIKSIAKWMDYQNQKLFFVNGNIQLDPDEQ